MRLALKHAALPAGDIALQDGLFVPAQSAPGAEESAVTHRASDQVAALYAERGAEFFYYARALAHNEELAKDSLQEAFMRYFIALCQGEEIPSPRAWIYRVLRNHLLDRIKHMRIHEERELRQGLPYNQDIEGACLRHEVLRLAQAALTPGEYRCLRLRTEGLRYGEIAARLCLTSGTVGTLVSRAMQKIRTLLASPAKES